MICLDLRDSLVLVLACLLLSACSAPSAPVWRESASSRFATALAAGSASLAPEETDNIRKTLELADRYTASSMPEEADKFYQLACQKSQLLYRNVVLSKVRQGSSILVEQSGSQQAEEVELDREHVSLQRMITEADDSSEGVQLQTEQSISTTATSSEHQAHTASGDFQTRQEMSPSPDPVIAAAAQAAPHSPDPSVHAKTTGTSLAAPLSANRTVPRSVPHENDTPNVGRKTAGIQPGSRTIYLTFDDGPSNLTIPIASYLKSKGIKATFFALGSNVKGREKAITETLAMGHRVGNHTLSHNLRTLNGSLDKSTNEIARTAAMIERLGGDGRMVRIPYGAVNKQLKNTVGAEGGQIFDWNINSNDSTRKGVRDPAFIENTVLGQLRRSSKKHIVLLFHDGAGHASTLTAIRNLIPRLQQEGYRFGLLSRSERVARLPQQGGTVQ